MIEFPLIGTLKVENLSISEIAKIIQEKLGEKYIKNPFVTVVVKEFQSKKIYVLGEVQRTGTFPFQENMNIIQAITLAGGFTNLARKNNIIVSRIENGMDKRFIVPVEKIGQGLAENFYLKPGDIIFVPETIL